eukprot:6174496-Amphidinium_carterae.1
MFSQHLNSCEFAKTLRACGAAPCVRVRAVFARVQFPELPQIEPNTGIFRDFQSILPVCLPADLSFVALLWLPMPIESHHNRAAFYLELQ